MIPGILTLVPAPTYVVHIDDSGSPYTGMNLVDDYSIPSLNEAWDLRVYIDAGVEIIGPVSALFPALDLRDLHDDTICQLFNLGGIYGKGGHGGQGGVQRTGGTRYWGGGGGGGQGDPGGGGGSVIYPLENPAAPGEDGSSVAPGAGGDGETDAAAGETAEPGTEPNAGNDAIRLGCLTVIYNRYGEIWSGGGGGAGGYGATANDGFDGGAWGVKGDGPNEDHDGGDPGKAVDKNGHTCYFSGGDSAPQTVGAVV